MGFITKYGSFWGMIPQTSGRIFWVSPSDEYTVEGRTYRASDGHDGLSPERAVRTLDRCFDANYTIANAGDVVVALPGAHSWATTTTIDIAGVTITGIPRDVPVERARTSTGGTRKYTSITTTASAHVLTVSAADVIIANLHVIPAAGFAGIAPDGAGDRLTVHDCTFLMATAANTATIGVHLNTAGADQFILRNCYFHVSDNQGPGVRIGDVAVLDPLIENSTFYLVGDTAWDDAIESINAGTLGLKIRDCDFLQRASGTAITDCIDVTGMTVDGATSVLRCYFSVGSDPLEATAVADNQVAECYLMQAAASVGGTLVLST